MASILKNKEEGMKAISPLIYGFKLSLKVSLILALVSTFSLTILNAFWRPIDLMTAIGVVGSVSAPSPIVALVGYFKDRNTE